MALWVLAVVLLVLLLCGCSRGGGQRVEHFTFEAPEQAPRAIDLPVHLAELPDHLVVYHLRASVMLDPGLAGRELVLVLPYLPAPVAVRAGGQEARLQGDVQPAAAYGAGLPRRWLLPSSATTGERPLDLDLAVTHDWSMSSRLDVAPELILADKESPRVERNRVLNEQGAWFGMVALSQVGMTFLAVYFWDRRRRAYLWFAIQALTASYYPAFILGLPLGWLGWKMETVVLAQSLAIAPIVSVYFTHAFFGLPRPHRAWLLLLAVGLVSPLVVLARTTDFLAIAQASRIVALCVVCGIAYQLATGVGLLRTHADRGIVVFFLCCWMALASSSWVDLLTWVGGPELLSGGRPACFGLGFFAIFQSMLLGRSHFRTLVEAEHLNERLVAQVHDLRERQSEIQNLNEELRRQIGRRSADILAALTAGDGTANVSLAPGDVVEGRYSVVAELGVGGMGKVYEVQRLSDSRHLALKVAQDVHGLALARLAREAQIATQLHHPNVVAVVDADVAQGGYAYLVMELVEGRSLAKYVGARPIPWCLDVMRQMLEGVRALHEQGIIHRDLKPSNVLISGNDDSGIVVKITDFGISRWEDGAIDAEAARPASKSELATVDTRAGARTGNGAGSAAALRDVHSTPQLTRTGHISGTPSYVAPELSGGTARLSPAVDVFSFGVVAYGMLTGKLPYVEPPLLARLAGRDSPVPPAVASVRPEVPAGLGDAIDACLVPDPTGRPSVGELLARLNPRSTPA
jgi:hypothetical protein